MNIEHRAVGVFEVASLTGILAVVLVGVPRSNRLRESRVALYPPLRTPCRLAFRRSLETGDGPRIHLAEDGMIASLRMASPPNRMSAVGVAPQRPQSPQGSWYGSLYAPPPDDLTELRRQQAEFARTTREIDKQNSWLAIPALAPAAAVFGLEGAAAIAGRALGAETIEGPLNFVDREAWQRGAQRAAQALSDAEKNALRSAARSKLARANGISTREMQAEVHHSEPLEWAHLKPNADPNRLANLWGLRGEAHDIATRA